MPHHIEIARVETERGELVLRERRDDEGAAAGTPVLELRANGVFVMDTAEVGTERALATTALDLVAQPSSVLVGGLGLGFTLREVLADSRVESATVVEIEQQLVDWMREGTVPHGPALLADARITVVVADLVQALAEARPESYDLVLLDVDNGPDHLVHSTNAALYGREALTRMRHMLRPGGAVAIWSAAHSPALQDTLGEVFPDSEARALDVHLQDRAEQYWLHLGRLPA